MGDAQLLAVDWGTTNRRVYMLAADGAVLATERDERGLLVIAPGTFAAEAAAIRKRFADLPMLCAGMVGSARGWAEAPYLECPASFGALARNLLWVEPGATAIVPGLSAEHGDVMRGEEVQLLGAVAAGLAPADALLCQPGTHCKWARMEQGMVVDFTTCMTGELFALLRNHSLLAPFLAGAVEDGAAFRAGVAEGLSGNLIAKLFGIRASALLGQRSEADSAAFASGLLIGADVASQTLAAGQTVHLLADPHLGGLYAAAITESGSRAVLVDSHTAFVAGITRIWSLADDRAS